MKTSETSFALFRIRQTHVGDEGIIAENFCHMWEDYNVDKILRTDWLEATLFFIKQVKAHLSFTAFVAETEEQIIGSAACQRFSGFYPGVFEQSERDYGYIWGVYAAPQYRGKGMSKALVAAANDYLKGIGCTRALLHASPMGKFIYTALDFTESNEMKLELVQ